MGYVQGVDRNQATIVTLDVMVAPDSEARLVDAFVDSLDLEKLGFRPPAAEGRPAYDPRSMLKLYVWGYRKGIRSSRKLAASCRENVEAMWLVSGVRPDFRTISDFRKDNAEAMREVFRALVERLSGAVAWGFCSVDGSKFRASNSKASNFTASKLDDRIEWLERHVDEYLGALDVYEIEGMEWSGAYWSQRRRELVAYLPADGARELLKTFRHEAFHQYLSYACSMITASPWINEGYAQYFEDTESADWGIEVDVEAAAEYLPSVLAMDYVQFYSGTSATRTFNYRMAWSVCYFLEKGAPQVRFQPFKDVKSDYMKAILRHHDMLRATGEAFGSRDALDKFVAEWKKFWLRM